VAGYLSATAVQEGKLGASVPQSAVQYFMRSAGGATIYPVATQTVYRNTDGTGAETTSYAYSWFPNTVAVQMITVTAPTITTAENGPGVADTETLVFDPYGQLIWTKDADGFLTYTAYDIATGAVVETIDDVNTALTGDFANLPSGWVTPTGGGAHLKTTYEVDPEGRTTKVTDPNGNSSYTVYNDVNHEMRVYAGWNATTNLPSGPTVLYREDRAGGYAETLTMSAVPSISGGRPTGTEAISNLQSDSRVYSDLGGQVINEDDYFNLSGLTYTTSTTFGTENTNFYRTRLQYEDSGQQNRVQTPNGTVYKTVYDGLGRPSADYVGTSDGNLVQTVGYEYDNGGIGDSDLTKVTQFPGGSDANRVTQFWYDWRDRLMAEKDGVQSTESNSVHRPIFFYTLDNLGEATRVQEFDGDNVTITVSGGVPQAPNGPKAQEDIAYDEQGRVYQTKLYSVDPNTGNVSTYTLTTNYWFDHRGNTIKTSEPGGLVTKDQYDGVGRVVKEFTTDGGGDTTWADAGNVTGDNVLEQVEFAYDANSNVIQTTTRQRFHDETATGSLGDPNNSPKARVYYSGAYYDAIDRLTATVDVGTNAGTAWTRPTTVPTPSDTALVTLYGYNAMGLLETVTDPRGIINKTYYDNLGQTVKTIEDFTNGTPTNSSDKTTEYTYDGDGHMLTLQADLAGGGFEKTQWTYGVSTGGGDSLNSNDILKSVQWPDPTTGNPSTSSQETYSVNALGEARTYTDRNGTTHSLTYDVLGRVTADAVTALGSGVDGSVRRIETAYDAEGNPYLFTSYDAASAGNIVNQVQDVFNGLGQLTVQYQSHSGAVDTVNTPKVQYAYTEMAGGANNSRLVSMTYPSQGLYPPPYWAPRTINYNYSSGLNDSISRLSSISDSSGTLESYDYIGLNTVVRRAHPLSGVDLTYIKQTGETNGDAGDQYTGLDRFGRVVDQRWIKTSTGTATDRFQYTYDRDGSRLTRTNALNSNFSETYSYDNLNQLTGFTRGTHSQSWSFDALGNWASFTTDGTTQTRTANRQNQITSISSQLIPAYDSNGNMLTDETGRQFVYDAWNRLVKVKDSLGNVLETFAYDALGRRISVTASGTTTDLYYSKDWQVLEERVSGNTKVQYVWSPVYVDALIERDRDADGNPMNGLEERLWVQQDANYNVTALANASGSIVERYAYDPFGLQAVYDANWNVRGTSNYGFTYGFQGKQFDATSGLLYSRFRFCSPTLGRWVQNDPLGFAAGDANLYRYVSNNPTNRVDPRGLIEDAAAGILVDNILNGSANLSELSALSPQQLAEAIAQLERAAQTPLSRVYPPELIRSFNEARIAFLRGAGERPGALLEYAEQWVARQTPEWVRANSALVERIATQAARARDMAARRAAQAAADAAAEAAACRAAQTTASRTSRFLGGIRTIFRYAGGPFTIAASEVLISPTPTAGPGRVGQNQLMFPAHSPEIYLLPKGTYIMQNGLIYVPGPNSTFRPPPGSVRVTGRVSGQDVLFRLQDTLSSSQVAPVPAP
jgi:RHS repeat-associated protein